MPKQASKRSKEEIGSRVSVEDCHLFTTQSLLNRAKRKEKNKKSC